MLINLVGVNGASKAKLGVVFVVFPPLHPNENLSSNLCVMSDDRTFLVYPLQKHLQICTYKRKQDEIKTCERGFVRQ